MTETHPEILTAAFRALSARLGQDPLQVQGPGGNTSIKAGGVMWIKASGTELAHAETQNIFVAVDRMAAVDEARRGAGDGSCKGTVIDPAVPLRPSIETTFHAALDHAVVAHTHSVATIAHAISPEGRQALTKKLAGLDFVRVPYAKPGLPLTTEIVARVRPETTVIILENHGLICCGDTVEEVSVRIAEVEERLTLAKKSVETEQVASLAPEGFYWAEESWLAHNPRATELALAGSYYPDHVVFLGPALPTKDHDGTPPVILIPQHGVAIRRGATNSQKAMLRCISDVLAHLPDNWTVEPIGREAEISLLNWDAEKYRQGLAARQ